MSPFFNSVGKLLISTLSLMKKCNLGANKSECSVRIFTGMLPKVEDFVGSKSLSWVSIISKETCRKKNLSQASIPIFFFEVKEYQTPLEEQVANPHRNHGMINQLVVPR